MNTDDEWSAAHGAVEFEDVIELRRLLASGGDPDERTTDGMTLLHHAVDVEIDGAAQSGTSPGTSTTRVIIEAGANPFHRWRGVLALDDAVDRRHSEAADLLVRTMRISPHGEVILKALVACLDDDIFPAWEFSTLMAAERSLVRHVLDSWPMPAPVKSDWATSSRAERDVIVNNVLNMFLGYPHGLDGEAFTARVGCSQRDAATTLMIWRDEEDWERGSKGFFNRLQ